MSKVFIIAEAGVNHNGDVAMAKKMIEAAKEAGVDAVKFQTGRPEMVVASWAVKADYQKRTTGADESQLDMIKKIALPFEAFKELQAHCAKVGITFFSTAFENPALDFLMGLGMDIIKIPSGEITNLPYLRRIASYARPGRQIILSTGMSNMDEIGAALEILLSGGVARADLCVLHCNTEYPTPMSDVNLRAMLTIRDRFGVRVGYSDHTPGVEVSVAAVALGAEVIEKHFTLDRTLPGPDQAASLEPNELAQLVTTIRNVEAALSGDGKKVASPSEKKNIPIARRSIVAARAIRKGERLDDDNLVAKRPATGISPMQWDQVVGTVAKRDFAPDELIEV